MADSALARVAKIIVFLLFVGAGIAGFFLGNPVHKLEASQDEACRSRCANMQKFHRLARALPAGAAPRGKYDGPWNCECY